MATKTPNLGLTKDDPNEFYDIAKVNVNLDLIDKKVGEIDGDIEELGQAIENIKIPVTSVNDKTGAVNLTASDVGASPVGHGHAYSEISGKPSTFPPSSHEHTPSQVGLRDVLNYGIATTAEAQAGVVNNKYMTPALVKAAVQYLAQNGGISMVKSVQRGLVATASGQSLTITHSAVNVNKSWVDYKGIVGRSTEHYRNIPVLTTRTATTFTIASAIDPEGEVKVGSRISWQVIEYM